MPHRECLVQIVHREPLIFSLVFLSLLSATPSIATFMQEERIHPYSRNPYYWQYRRAPVLLLGGSEIAELFQWTGHRLGNHLDLLRSVGGNYVRNIVAAKHPDGVFPFRKTNELYDLNRWNNEFWIRLDSFLRETHRRRIVVQIEIWDGWDFYGNRWNISPWNPKNNANYTARETGIPTTWFKKPHDEDNAFVLTVPLLNNVRTVLHFQERFVRKILAVCLKYDHVLYTIQNESAAPHAWSDYWAKFLHTEAAKRGKNIEVSDMREKHNVSGQGYQYVLDRMDLYTFIDISQNNHTSGQTHWDRIQGLRGRVRQRPRPMNNTKVYIKTSGWPVTNEDEKESTDRFWRNIFGGAASSRFHRSGAYAQPPRPPEEHWGHGLNTTAQTHIKSMRMFTDAMDIFSTEPRNDLLSDLGNNEAYTLAEVGKQYAIFFPNGGSVKIDLKSASGKLKVRWFDITKSAWVAGAIISGGDSATLTAPGNGQWAVLITATDTAI